MDRDSPALGCAIPSSLPATQGQRYAKKGDEPLTSNDNEQLVSHMEWHYSKDGHRFGPVTEDQIIEQIKMKKITEQSFVWNRTMTDWQPILISKFADLMRDPNVPPPLTGAAVSNTIIWVLAFAPLIGIFLEGFFSGLTGIPQKSLWFIPLVLNIVLGYADEKRLKSAGHDTSKMGAAWLVPVYLFKRAKILKHNYAYFIVWCVLFGLSLIS
jgi:hypothetical protein